MKRVFFLCTLIISLGSILFFFVIKNDYENRPKEIVNRGFFCGTRSFNSYSYGEASIGKGIFNTNCAACHKLDKRMTGPALRGITQKYDSITLYNYIQDKPTKSLNRTTSGFTCTVFPQLTPEDISNVLMYTN